MDGKPMTAWTRRLLVVVGLIAVTGPAEDVAMHHSIAGVLLDVGGAWLISLCLVRGDR